MHRYERRSSTPLLSVPFSAVVFLFGRIKENFTVQLMLIYLLSVLYDYSIFILSFLLYFSFGWIFFIKKLFVAPASTTASYQAFSSNSCSSSSVPYSPSRAKFTAKFRHESLQKHIIHIIFAVTLALSCALFQLIIFEILNILDPT